MAALDSLWCVDGWLSGSCSRSQIAQTAAIPGDMAGQSGRSGELAEKGIGMACDAGDRSARGIQEELTRRLLRRCASLLRAALNTGTAAPDDARGDARARSGNSTKLRGVMRGRSGKADEPALIAKFTDVISGPSASYVIWRVCQRRAEVTLFRAKRSRLSYPALASQLKLRDTKRTRCKR